ncbi:coiled-coil domain-containing protein 125 [Neolamprologus brichardi]|uniref:coiled-coil domain-containing protein 125 n=1 Tax=Neolamprologus brichardi TaxID=32507 RepID=UPI001643827E|nr:coiled-coil domain-containing protein 125 [Neolamprologus brichardi]
MEELSEDCSLNDDMVDGDLGDGIGVTTALSSTRMKSERVSGRSESRLLRADPLQCSSRAGEAVWTPTIQTAETQQRAQRELSYSDDYHSCAILDKATSHTKSVLQKTEEKAKALEKEVNSLQWELSFSQAQMKKSEQSWELKHSRVSGDNKILTDKLQEMESESQQLRAENAALKRQYLELLSMLNVKEQRIYQATKPQYSLDTESGVLELTVLGACQCVLDTEPCPCSRTAAASRKQLVQLQQELDAQRLRKEEALMVADAFRIAFEQQLRKRSEEFLLVAEANIKKSNHSKAEGANKSPLISVSKRLKALLPSGLEMKVPDEHLETLYKLLDLLNDKEEALAHQRKVSIMLAHSAEELQRQLHLGSSRQLQDPPDPRIQQRQPQGPLENQSQSQRTSETPEPEEVSSECKLHRPPQLSESRTDSEGV